MPFVVITIIIGLFIAFAVFSYLQTVKRREALSALASRHGWAFTSDKNRGVEDRYAAFGCLQQGSGRYAYNIMTGPAGSRAVCAFDYHYETTSTDSEGRTQTHNHHFSALVLETGSPLRPLFIRPENFFDRIGSWFGFDDIDFESDEFSRRFCVNAEDRRWAYDVISQSTMEFLLTSPEFSIQFAGEDVIAYRGSLFEPFEFEQALAVLAGMIDRLPKEMLRESKGSPS